MDRNQDNHSLKEALRHFINANRLQGGIDRIDARKAWESLMGNGVNHYTSSVELKGDTLYVSLTSSVLREELSHGKTKIIKLLNEEIGKDLIKKIVLR